MRKFLIICSIFFTSLTLAADQNIQLKDIGIFNSLIPDEKFSSEMTDLRLNRLEWHKRFAHLTSALILASFGSAYYGRKEIDDARNSRGGVKSTEDAKELHLHMGISLLTLLSYSTTAYYSLSAPKPVSFSDDSKRSWHKNLAYIHGTSMALAPILGFMAFKKYHDGKNPSGVSKLHRPVMMIGSLAFFVSFSVMTF